MQQPMNSGSKRWNCRQHLSAVKNYGQTLNGSNFFGPTINLHMHLELHMRMQLNRSCFLETLGKLVMLCLKSQERHVFKN